MKFETRLSSSAVGWRKKLKVIHEVVAGHCRRRKVFPNDKLEKKKKNSTNFVMRMVYLKTVINFKMCRMYKMCKLYMEKTCSEKSSAVHQRQSQPAARRRMIEWRRDRDVMPRRECAARVADTRTRRWRRRSARKGLPQCRGPQRSAIASNDKAYIYYTTPPTAFARATRLPVYSGTGSRVKKRRRRRSVAHKHTHARILDTSEYTARAHTSWQANNDGGPGGGVEPLRAFPFLRSPPVDSTAATDVLFYPPRLPHYDGGDHTTPPPSGSFTRPARRHPDYAARPTTRRPVARQPVDCRCGPHHQNHVIAIPHPYRRAP